MGGQKLSPLPQVASAPGSGHGASASADRRPLPPASLPTPQPCATPLASSRTTRCSSGCASCSRRRSRRRRGRRQQRQRHQRCRADGRPAGSHSVSCCLLARRCGIPPFITLQAAMQPLPHPAAFVYKGIGRWGARAGPPWRMCKGAALAHAPLRRMHGWRRRSPAAAAGPAPARCPRFRSFFLPTQNSHVDLTRSTRPPEQPAALSHQLPARPGAELSTAAPAGPLSGRLKDACALLGLLAEPCSPVWAALAAAAAA